MPKKTEFVLEKGLASKVFDEILLKRNTGTTGYAIAKAVYGENSKLTANIYDTLKELRTADLIIETEITDSKNPNAKCVKPNWNTFLIIIADKLLPKLTDEKEKNARKKKIEITASLFDELNPIENQKSVIIPEDVKKAAAVLEEQAGFVNVIDSTAFQIKFIASLVENRKKIPIKIKNALGNETMILLDKMPQDVANEWKQLSLNKRLQKTLDDNLTIIRGILAMH